MTPRMKIPDRLSFRLSILVVVVCFFNFPNGDTLFALETKKVQLMITADIHGWISTSLVYPRRKRKGLLHLVEIIEKVRTKYPESILLDAGDLLKGSPLTHYYQHLDKHPSFNDPFFLLVQSLKYDAIVVGNHDLSVNPLFESAYLPVSSFPWLAANVVREKMLVFTPYVIVNRSQLKIAILGFTTPGAMMWLNPENLMGMVIKPLQDSAKYWIKFVNKKEKPDLIIGVFHVGLNSLRDDENSKLAQIYQANNLKGVLNHVSGFDLIVSGHDHRLYPYKQGQKIRYIKKTPVVSGGNWAEALIRIELDVAGSKEAWEVKSILGEIFKAKQDKKIDYMYRQSLSKDYLHYINEKLPWRFTKTNNKQVSDCLNLLIAKSQFQKDLAGTMFPLIKVSQTKHLKNKKISRLDLFRWIKYDNRAVTVKLSRRDIHLLEHPIPNYSQRNITYNRRLFSWFKIPLKHVEEDTWWLQSDCFERKHYVKISDYHYQGGGGIVPALFLGDSDQVKRSTEIIQERLYHYLKQEIKSMPKECRFIKYDP